MIPAYHHHNNAQQGATMRIKDPCAKGNKLYDVPIGLIELTYGFSDHYDALFARPGLRKPTHRACLCRLYQEGRCGQGTNCKSFHVDREFVKKCRAAHGVVLEQHFLNEVAVTLRGRLFAVRFPAVLRTRGLENYKAAARDNPSKISPTPLCTAHNPGLGLVGSCHLDRNCPYIHVKHSELKDLDDHRLRTPCCSNHGGGGGGAGFVSIRGGDGRSWTVSLGNLADTEGLVHGVAAYPPGAVCVPHITARCKFGSSCDKLHVCRSEAVSGGLIEWLEHQSSSISCSASGCSGSSCAPSSPPPEALLMPGETGASGVEEHQDEDLPPALLDTPLLTPLCPRQLSDAFLDDQPPTLLEF